MVKRLLKIPTYLAYVTTLPLETLVLENKRFYRLITRLIAVCHCVVVSARIICGRVYVTIRCPSVCLAARLAPRPRHAAGLLLWAPRASSIDRLLHSLSAAGAAAFRSTSIAAQWKRRENASSVDLGSWDPIYKISYDLS